MIHNNQFKSQLHELRAERPVVTSYDSFQEHSFEHWIEVRRMVEQAQNEENVVTELKVFAASV